MDTQFKDGKSYSSINSCRAAISLVLSITKEDEPLIKRYFRGLYNANPPAPKYDVTWDPHPVLTTLEKMFPLDSLSIEQLTLKTVTLLALISGHRVETFAKIKISNITEYEDRIEIRVSDKIKTTKINSF